MNIPLLIARLRPNSAYHWRGGAEDDYSAVGEWRDPNTTKPTLEELQAEEVVYQGELAAAAVQAGIIEQDRAAARDNQVQEALFAITARRTQIDSDLTALAAATTLAATRPIIQRLLQAESQTLQALAVVIRALRRLA